MFCVLFFCRRPLDPSTDEFYRDAGVRLTTAKSPASKTSSSESRIPSIPGRVRPALKAPSAGLPHFGIARGVQQVQPQPSIAYGVTVAPPMRRDVTRRGPVVQSPLNAAKSRSQENLNVLPKPRAARPVSTCLGPNDLLAASKQNPFIRNRHRASIGGTAPALKHVAPPIATLPPARPADATKWGQFSRASPAKAQASTGPSVKLSDMKNALPVTPFPPRKLAEQPWNVRRRTTDPPRPAASTTTDESTTAQQMMESLQLSSSRLGSKTAGTKSTAVAESMQRRTAWRRSLHFTTATSSPPPPPPRKNFATLPTCRTAQPATNNNNINNNNNNNIQVATSSKLPVPAFKRNSHLGSNF